MKIIDKKIAPYEIHVDTVGNYTVVMEMPNKSNKGETVYTDKGYYTSMENALNKITKLMVEKEEVFTIKEYVDQITDVRDSLINLG